MQQMIKYSEINLEEIKRIFLLNAREGNPGIYELTWELGSWNLSIDDNYKIAKEVLLFLIEKELVIIEKFKDLEKTEKLIDNPKLSLEEILNNPRNWYPCDEIYSIEITESGLEYLSAS